MIFNIQLYMLVMCMVAGTASAGCANRTSTPEALLLPLAGPRRVLIIGDSLTERSAGFGLAGTSGLEVSFLGVPGYDFRDWTGRLDEALARPGGPIDIVLVPLGTNDGYRFGPSDHRANLRSFDAELRLRTAVAAWYFLMPRTNDPALSANIRANNQVLRDDPPVAAAGFIDLDTPFEEARAGTALYPLNDPIHPTEAGYRVAETEIRRRLALP